MKKIKGKQNRDRNKAKAKKSRLKKIDETLLSKEVQIEFAAFLQQYPPKHFSRNFRKMTFQFMETQMEGVALYTDKLLIALERFFDVLDVAEDNWKEVDIMEIWKYRYNDD
jgi:hypothetical protein